MAGNVESLKHFHTLDTSNVPNRHLPRLPHGSHYSEIGFGPSVIDYRRRSGRSVHSPIDSRASQHGSSPPGVSPT